MAPPYVIKPNNEGSSVGVQIVRTSEERLLARNDWPFGPEVLVERYVPGRELTVAVLGDRPLTVTEIRPRHGFMTTTPSTPSRRPTICIRRRSPRSCTNRRLPTRRPRTACSAVAVFRGPTSGSTTPSRTASTCWR